MQWFPFVKSIMRLLTAKYLNTTQGGKCLSVGEVAQTHRSVIPMQTNPCGQYWASALSVRAKEAPSFAPEVGSVSVAAGGERFWQSLLPPAAFRSAHPAASRYTCRIRWNWILSSSISDFTGSKPKNNSRFVCIISEAPREAEGKPGSHQAEQVTAAHRVPAHGKEGLFAQPLPPARLTIEHNKIQKKQGKKSSYSQMRRAESKNTVTHKTNFLKLTSSSASGASLYLQECLSKIAHPSITSAVAK